MDKQCPEGCERRITLDKNRLFFLSPSEMLEYLSEKYRHCPAHGPVLAKKLQENRRGGCECAEIVIRDWIKFAATDNIETSTFLDDLKRKFCQKHSISLARVPDSSPRSKLGKVILQLLS